MVAEQLKVLSRVKESFESRLRRSGEYPIKAGTVEVLQINVTRRCNLSCRHCHVHAGPGRTEEMSAETLEKCLAVVHRWPGISTIDITGGAPEMNSHLESFLARAAALGRRLIVRSNLVILLEPPYTRFLDIYAANKTEIVASMPDFRAERTDRQRGEKVFDRLIQALRLLCARGYGDPDSCLTLNLVHNPVGAFLPGSQSELERQYRRILAGLGVKFNKLLCLANMPVGRYLEYLEASGNFDDYIANLCAAYNPSAVGEVMCRSMVSVGWDGRLFDCDFNQMLDLQIDGCPATIEAFDMDCLSSRIIRLHNHCYGCTAGDGSSCQGSLSDHGKMR